MNIQNIRYLSNADNFIMAHVYETIHIRPPLSYHWHVSICLTLAQRWWKSLSFILLIGLTAGSGTTTWRLWTHLLTFPVLHPVIAIFSDCVKYLAGRRFAMRWHETSCHLLGPDACHRFLLGCVPALLTWWDKHLSVCGDAMEVLWAPFATHLPCTHEVKMMFLASECLFFWNSWVGYRNTTTTTTTTTTTHYYNLSVFV